MLGGAGSPGGDELLTVTVVRDENGYGMKVSGDNPVYVQSVKEAGAAWRAGLRAGDRILRVDGVPVHTHTHQSVVQMIKSHPSTVLTVHQNAQRHKTPITAPLPVNWEKQKQVQYTNLRTFRLMLEKERNYIRELKEELSKVPDVRKQNELESAELRCLKLQHEIDTLVVSKNSSPDPKDQIPVTPPQRPKTIDKPIPPTPSQNATSFLSGIPRSLSNLTGQSLRNLRQRQSLNKSQDSTPILRQSSEDSTKNIRRHNNTVPMVPTTCLDNTSPPPLPPRTFPLNPMAKPLRYSGPSYPHPKLQSPMHQSMPSPQLRENPKTFRRSSHSLDGELDMPQPNSIAMQLNYPLINVPPPSLQTDNRSSLPPSHVRSQSSPEHLEHGNKCGEKEWWERGTPPPGTPPPPYVHNTQPCSDPQRAIISMEDDDSPASDNSSTSGLFCNLRSVRNSKARMAVLLNWLLAEKRCACANLFLIITDGYRSAVGVPINTLRRWAFEIHSTFLMPSAPMALDGVDENMANEIEHVLENEYEKEEILRNVFRKARQKAKDKLTQQLTEFQVKRQVGLGSLYGPEDSVLEKCDVDKQQEQIVIEQLITSRLRNNDVSCGGLPAQPALTAAMRASAYTLHARPATIAAAAGGQSRATFLQRDKHYKQRLKHLAKQNPQPFIVRGHHLTLHALTSAAHCHSCDLPIWGLAPQSYYCAECRLRVHRSCARTVEEACVGDGEQHNNRISRLLDRIHYPGQDSSEKKSRKTSNTSHFLNMERGFRKAEEELADNSTLSNAIERRDESDESLYESADCHSDAISASDDALPHFIKTPTISKESLKLAITDEEVELVKKNKKGHRKAMSLSNPLELMRNFGDEWLDSAKKELEKTNDRKKSRESLWSEEDRDSMHGSNQKLDQVRKNSKKEDKTSCKSSANEQPKIRKNSKSSSALNFLRRKKTSVIPKTVEVLAEVVDGPDNIDEMIVSHTKFFLEAEKRHASICESRPLSEDTDSDEDELAVTPKSVIVNGDHRRRLSRQTSRSKSKVRGKSQSVKVNTLRKSHSGTLKKAKKKSVKTPLTARSRQASFAEPSLPKKNSIDLPKHNSWLFSSHKGESKREGSSEEPAAADVDVDAADVKDQHDKEHSGVSAGRGVARAESCREREAARARRAKQRNASDPNRLTAPHHSDLESSAAAAPSGSSSSSSLSSRSNESNTPAADHQASQSEWSEDEEPPNAVWSSTLPQEVLEQLDLTPNLRKRQEVIHELIVSEASHVRWLKVLYHIFARPLEQAQLLPQDEVKSLFPNLPAVRDRHTKLYAELKALRREQIITVRDVTDVMIHVLSEPGYAQCLAKFCKSQRMALDRLRERRRKNKELHQFLQSREQLPLCGRLQLRDLLACVWQRLTKYQLLLESLQKTLSPDDCDRDLVTSAHNTAKLVLHSVDTAIRTAENEHRLRTIQSKLEVRGCTGPEAEELKRLDLTRHELRHEGELALRTDHPKKNNVLALMLPELLVLLHREGDRYILKPITTPVSNVTLSPIIKWSTVLFRPNAAVKNTFFLMNINSVQMHELSTNTAAEYATWTRCIQSATLAEARATSRNLHMHLIDTANTSVSRNPSDASDKTNASQDDVTKLTDNDVTKQTDSDVNKLDNDVAASDGDATKSDVEEAAKNDAEGAEAETRGEEEAGSRGESAGDERKAVSVAGCVSLQPAELIAPGAVCVAEEQPFVAVTAVSPSEQLRRLDNTITEAIKQKTRIVGAMLGVPPEHHAQVSELAMAEALGLVDINHEMKGACLDQCDDDGVRHQDIHHLLLAAHQQANHLTEALSRAISVSDKTRVVSRAGRGLCDNCHANSLERPVGQSSPVPDASFQLSSSVSMLDDSLPISEHAGINAESAELASRLIGVASDLRNTLDRLVAVTPSGERLTHYIPSAYKVDVESHVELICFTEYQMGLATPRPGDNQLLNLPEQTSNGG